ncbi:hypothetical protein AA313_de0204560 [Arthrobotrys entomopaga]|nr:hypothetical protein AA313_de0204560 [Arthrobotrys entomopaga]
MNEQPLRATPKAIEERIAKLKREAKALDSRCAVQPSAPHKPKGNYYTAPPVPGQHYGGTKRKIAQTEEERKDEGEESEKGAGGRPTKKPRTAKKKKTAKKTQTAASNVGEKAEKVETAETTEAAETTEVTEATDSLAQVPVEDSKMEESAI